MRQIALALVLASAPAAAQGITEEVLPEFNQNSPDITILDDPEAAASGEGAILRALDKVSGEAVDLELAPGESATFGRLSVALGDCRYPEGNPAGDAFAWIEVTDPARDTRLFGGWMIASSPALNPLDHPRYDVWVLRCITS